jgi:16S rRNA (cytosine1402-N4)-methyltransferase
MEKKSTRPKTHVAVLTNEMIDFLDPQPGKTYIDATFGCGGHSRAILEKEKTCKVIAIDLDKTTIEEHAPSIEKEFGNRFKAVWGNFSAIYKILKKEKISKVDGIIADFGTSHYQIHHREGFSFLHDTPLDMRMSKAHSYFTAEYIVNKFDEKELANIFFEFGEERSSRKIAKAIINHREQNKIETTRQLASLIESVIPRRKGQRTHPATRVFQALRIFVNKELESIRLFLPAAISFLKQGGRFICISFHSLEDRAVKIFFNQKKLSGNLNIITRKPITAGEEEQAHNPSSRSAKMRVAEKI